MRGTHVNGSAGVSGARPINRPLDRDAERPVRAVRRRAPNARTVRVLSSVERQIWRALLRLPGTLPDLVERASGLRLGEVEDAAGNFGQP